MTGCRLQNSMLRRRLSFEALEDRQMLAVFTVTNLNDAAVTGPNQAPGTLRQAIFDANALAGADVIQFSAGLSGAVELSIVGDSVAGSSALLVSSQITIQGNSNGITLERSLAADEMRLFRVTSAGNLKLESIMLAGGLVRGANGAAPGLAGEAARGGAILNQGTLEVVASTLFNNSAIGGNATGAAGGQGLGGAIANDGGTLTLKNTTLSGNSAVSGTGNMITVSIGGGIHSLNGLAKIYNSTISGNSAATGRQLYVLAQFGTATLEVFSSIMAQQDDPHNTSDVTALADTDGQLFVSGANNIVRSEVGLTHLNSINDDPLLAPLADNGGPTLTRAIPVTSPAINNGSNLLNLTNDQRGSTFSRTIGGVVDIGALELQTAPALPGDYNRDETVDAADYVLWRKTMGSSVSTFDGADGDGSGYVDPDDYPVWTENFGEELISGSGGNRTYVEPTLSIAVGSVKLVLPFLYDFTAPTELDDDAVQIEAPLEPLQVSRISDDIHDKALLAVLWSWDSAARRQTGDAGV